jgi:hypothetical protein
MAGGWSHPFVAKRRLGRFPVAVGLLHRPKQPVQFDAAGVDQLELKVPPRKRQR